MLRNFSRFRPILCNVVCVVSRQHVHCTKHKAVAGIYIHNSITARYCHQETTGASTNHEDVGEAQSISDDDIKEHILETSMDFVTTHGWSIEALAEGAKAIGYPGVAHGMFSRGGADLMHYFVTRCNSRLAQQLAEEAKQREQDPEALKKRVPHLIRDAIENRLRMIIPYIKHWPQAMALTAVPVNTKDHFIHLSDLMDDIWFYAGDKSAGMNWYSKRLTLLALYKSTEIYLIQDTSPGYEDTWKFLDRRLADLNNFSKSTASFGTVTTGLNDFATAAFTVGRNIVGMNNTSR